MLYSFSISIRFVAMDYDDPSVNEFFFHGNRIEVYCKGKRH